MKKLALVIFRNNLRVLDNKALFSATKDCETVIGIYDLNLLDDIKSSFRKEFIIQTIHNLEKNLKRYGINLCYTKDISCTLEKLSKEYMTTIYFAKEVGTYEETYENKLKKFSHKEYFEQTLIEPFEFDYTNSFSHFRKKAEKKEIDTNIETPRIVNSIDLKSELLPSTFPNLVFKGGEDEALERVNHYMKYIHDYIETRNEMSGLDSSTKFSPYLACGAISPRTIYKILKKEENKTFSSKSSYWIYFELLWRDFFHMVMLQSKNKLFLKTGLKNIDFNFNTNKKSIESICLGNTGVDIIDASSKELTSTGWLSNSNRQLLASYWTKNLGLDFRIGAKWFEDLLIDYSPASNWGNWAYISYVGNDKRYNVFDPQEQSKLYNGNDYIKKWLYKEETSCKVDYRRMA